MITLHIKYGYINTIFTLRDNEQTIDTGKIATRDLYEAYHGRTISIATNKFLYILQYEDLYIVSVYGKQEAKGLIAKFYISTLLDNQFINMKGGDKQ